MTVFVPESIKVLGSDAGGASVVLCDMFVDDIADLPAPDAYTGYKLSMGCTATVINDNSRHRINSAGQWVQIMPGNSTYTRAEIDSMIARIDATEAEDRAALIAQVDSGAKNLVDAPSGSGIRYINIPIVLQPGDYYVKFKNITSTDTGASVCQFGAFAEDNSQAVTNFPQLRRGDDTGAMFTVTKQTSYVRLYASSSYAGGEGDTVTFTGCMICTAAYWAISQKYVSYALSNPVITPAVIKSVDDGAKNIADFTSATKTVFTTLTSHGVTITRNSDIFTVSGTSDTNENIFFNIYYEGSPSTKIIPPGNWVALIEDYMGSVAKDIAVQIALPSATPKVYGVPVQFSLSGSESGNWLRVNLRPSTTYNGSFRLMICSQEDYAISSAFVPYRPSWQEMWEMIQSYHP